MDWLALVESADLQLAFCGLTAIDWELLRRCTEYDGDFWSQHPVIGYFWSYVCGLDNDRSRRLLKLWTSSEVCPHGLRLYIMSAEDSDRLPCGQTCTGFLIMPNYATQEKMLHKLDQAVDSETIFRFM